MKLHANHRTCPSSRLLICQRVLEREWTPQQAAEAAGCSVRTAAKWIARFRAGDRDLLDRSSRPRRCPARLSPQRVHAIETLRRLRLTAAEIAEVLDLPLSTVSLWLKLVVAEADRAWQAVSPGAARAAKSVRATAPRRARPRRHQEARPDLKLGRRPPRARRPPQPTRASDRRPDVADDRLRVPARDDRRPHAPCLRRSAPRSHRGLRDRLPAARRSLVCRTRRSCARRHERQRLLLHRPRLRRSPRRAPAHAPPDQTRPPSHQRQGRANDPDTAQRMGLRPHLRQLRRTHRRARSLPRPIQLQTTTRQPRPQTAGLETEQPRWELHLAEP